MSGHLSEETLMDVVDATADPRAREHAQACPSCRTRVSEAAEAWTMAQGTDVPEPSPLYWAAFRRQVDQRIHRETPRRRFVRFLLPLAAAAGLVWAVAGPRTISPSPVASPPVATVLPAWSALPPVDEDPGFEVLQAMASGGSDLALAYDRGGIHEFLWDLSEEESRALAERLQSDGAKAGAL